MIISDQHLDKQKVKKYNINFSSLSKLILDMSEDQQLLLLEKAQQIIDSKKKKNARIPNLNKNWIFMLGFLIGWVSVGFLIIFFGMNLN